MKWVISGSAIISLFVIAPIAYMMADNEPPYEYDAEQSYVVPSSPTPSGQQLVVHWAFKKVNRVCAGSFTRVIVDVRTKIRITYDPTPLARTVAKNETYVNRTFFLPYFPIVGEKEYFAETEFACNPLQRLWPLRITTPRLTFYIAKTP